MALGAGKLTTLRRCAVAAAGAVLASGCSCSRTAHRARAAQRVVVGRPERRDGQIVGAVPTTIKVGGKLTTGRDDHALPNGSRVGFPQALGKKLARDGDSGTRRSRVLVTALGSVSTTAAPLITRRASNALPASTGPRTTPRSCAVQLGGRAASCTRRPFTPAKIPGPLQRPGLRQPPPPAFAGFCQSPVVAATDLEGLRAQVGRAARPTSASLATAAAAVPSEIGPAGGVRRRFKEGQVLEAEPGSPGRAPHLASPCGWRT